MQAGPRFLEEAKLLLETLGVQEAPWLSRTSSLFGAELRSPSQFQVRLDASFVGLVVRSVGADIRSHMYALLSESHLDFQVASRCEDLAKLYPDAGWMGKISLSGADMHAKLFMEQILNLEEVAAVLSVLEVPGDVGRHVAEGMLGALGISDIHRISASPGEPVRAEIYGYRGDEPGGGVNSLPALLEMAQLSEEPEAEALLELHQGGSRIGGQRYVVGMDGRGMRTGLKVEYTEPSSEFMEALVHALVPGPIFGMRRLKNTQVALGGQEVDHVSVRLRPGRPAHLTVYFDRSFLSVA